MESRPVISTFSVGEELYYRTDPKKIKKPYDDISLYDISHNRSFLPQTSVKDDVLYNIKPGDVEEKYTDKEVVVLLIGNLNNAITFVKEFKTEDESHRVVITLKHSPVECMYPHSVFEITVNEIVIDSENYKAFFGIKSLKNIRGRIRQELTSMIQSGIIDSSTDIEMISEP